MLPAPHGRGVFPLDLLQLYRSWLAEMPEGGHPAFVVVRYQQR